MFNAVCDNSDLSVHPDPVRPDVAVVCRWKDAHRFRDRHPGVSVVGPLRTLRGIDLLFRSLLANPQIREVWVEGTDLTPGEATTEALFATWLGADQWLGPDVVSHAKKVREHISLVQRTSSGEVIRLILATSSHSFDAVVLPPPRPEVSASAPHGDPGQRVVGDTLEELWPRALQQAMHFGRTAPTQYGDTREVINLVSVIRDPARAFVLPSWIPGHEQVDDYARRLFVDALPPEGAMYSYSSRLHGHADGHQMDRFREMMRTSPSTRAAFITPWDPSQDAGLESGRPCMVGAWFRQVDNRLHMTLMFRSHDLFAAYPLNLASACCFLQSVASEHSMLVGTLTCISFSAHVYERDFSDANTVIVQRMPKQIGWDLRSTWRVERRGDVLCAVALTPDGASVVNVFEGTTPESVRSQVERSGLLQSVGNALWLGDELRRVHSGS